MAALMSSTSLRGTAVSVVSRKNISIPVKATVQNISTSVVAPTAFGGCITHFNTHVSRREVAPRTRPARASVAARAGSDEKYDYDLIIIGCGVGGHGAALHAVEQGMKVAVIEGSDIGGTCVNRGCVPSKALLAASGRVRDLKNEMHLKSMGIQVGAVSFDREGIADHASNLVKNIQKKPQGLPGVSWCGHLDG